MKTIALCFSTPDLQDRFYKDYGKKYPGAGWMKHLPSAITGKEAIHRIGTNELNPKDIYIVQEELNQDGILLQSMGANPTVLTCLESPIFASFFYDQQETEKGKFKHSILFDSGTEHLHFPSFDNEDIRDPVPWSNRKFLCAVVSNKHYLMLGDGINKSPSFQWATKTQLHDYRYESLSHFLGLGSNEFDLYGKGWGEKYPECPNKLDTIRNYKFTLCFENGSYPGYLTEKIIDSLVAGVVPIYRGTPDVYSLIPRDFFVNSNHYETFKEMEEDLKKPWKWEHTIRDAQRWLLKNENGQKYSNQYFANRILELCE